MRKLFKLLTSRLFITALAILIELALIIVVLLLLNNFVNYYSYLYLVFSFVSIVTMLYIVSCRGNVAYTVSWLFFVGALPLIGTACYLIFGRKRFTKRQQRKVQPIIKSLESARYDNHYLKLLNKESEDAQMMMSYVFNMSKIPPFNNTEVSYFKLGDEVWPKMLEELKKARHYIFLEYFIISKGKMWDSILTILKEKASEGIDVRVLYDDFGSISYLPNHYPEKLKKMGIKCIAYNRFKPIINVKMNNRDHRKIMVIDGHTGFTGGINIADEYVNLKVKFGHWKDNAIMLKGEGVWGLTSMFLSMWSLASGVYENQADYHYDKYANELGYNPKSTGFVQPFGDIPYDYEPLAETIYIQTLMKAKKYVYITTPYLILSPELEFALCATAKQGVRVVILTPHIPDKKLVFSVTKSYYRNLLEAGVKIYEYTPGFVHSKMFVSDDAIAIVGTANLDYRSMFLHFECGTICYKVPAIMEMKKDFEECLNVSQEIPTSSVKNLSVLKRLWWGFLKVFATLM